MSGRKHWDRVYAHDPDVFGVTPSRFARWSLPRVARLAPPVRLLELGAGNGRDVRYFRRRGVSALGVDSSPVIVRHARSRGPGDLRRAPFVEAEAEGHLAATARASLDVVYSNLFLNLGFDHAAHRALFDEVRRSLRAGGLHLYSARSVTDPWYGRGRAVGPDTFDLAPDGPVLHFFSRAYARALAHPGFRVEAIEPHREGGRAFPTEVLYVASRRTKG